MKKRRLLQGLLICFLLLGFSLIPARTAKAAVQKAPSHYWLEAGKRFKGIDVTGDRKEDTFAVARIVNNTTRRYTGAVVQINKKTVYQFRNTYYEDMKIGLVTLKNGAPFIYLYAQADNGDGPVCALFQYRSGRLVKVIDFQTFAGRYGIHEYGRLKKISGNSVVASYNLMSWSLGTIQLNYTYTYNNGTLKRTRTVGSIIRNGSTSTTARTLTANRSVSAYKSPGSKTRAYVLRKGNKAVLTGRCWMNRGLLYFEVSRNGVKGWVRGYYAQPKTSRQKQFSNVTYAG